MLEQMVDCKLNHRVHGTDDNNNDDDGDDNDDDDDDSNDDDSNSDDSNSDNSNNKDDDNRNYDEDDDDNSSDNDNNDDNADNYDDDIDSDDTCNGNEVDVIIQLFIVITISNAKIVGKLKGLVRVVEDEVSTTFPVASTTHVCIISAQYSSPTGCTSTTQ